MGAAFLLLRQVDVDTFAPDPDPNTVDPDTDPLNPLSVVLPVRPLEAQLESVARIFSYCGYEPKTPAITLSYLIYIKDEETGIWLLMDDFSGAVVHTKNTSKVASGIRVFARVTAINGGAPAGGLGYVRGLPAGSFVDSSSQISSGGRRRILSGGGTVAAGVTLPPIAFTILLGESVELFQSAKSNPPGTKVDLVPGLEFGATLRCTANADGRHYELYIANNAAVDIDYTYIVDGESP